MIRKMAFLLTVAFFAVSLPLFSQESQPMQAEPAQEAQPAAVQPAPAPAAPTASFESAMKLYRRGRYDAAISAFEQVVANEPNNAAAWYFMGYAHYVKRHLAQAQEAFQKAFAANPAFDPRPFFKG
jgi:tetratricopeptide (TPR) repeat protein